jgi:hypothetical protein
VIVALSPGVAQYIFLTDNTTIQGVWASVTLGLASRRRMPQIWPGTALSPSDRH